MNLGELTTGDENPIEVKNRLLMETPSVDAEWAEFADRTLHQKIQEKVFKKDNYWNTLHCTLFKMQCRARDEDCNGQTNLLSQKS